MTYALWFAEFLLELSGAVLSYRKRLTILCALLSWRAFMDLVTAPLFFFPDSFNNGYALIMWAGRAAQYAILYALGVQIAAKMIADYRPITQYVYKTVAIVASVATYIFVVTKVWEHRFLFAETVTCALLLAVVLLGWIGRKGRLEEPWNLITGGIVISAAGNSLCALLATQSPQWLSLYPIPALAALLLWNLAALRNQRKDKQVSCGGVQQGRLGRDVAGDLSRLPHLIDGHPRNQIGNVGGIAEPHLNAAGIKQEQKPPSSVWIEPMRHKVN